MQIILEGPDNAGKSTLAQVLAERFGREIIPSEGREKFSGEINDRVRRYFNSMETGDLIFDRHPCVSHPIYGHVVPNTPVDPKLIDCFYKAFAPLFIYVRPANPARRMKGHVANQETDDSAYLQRIDETYVDLLTHYDTWALKHAHITYRIGDDIERVIRMVRGAVA